MIKNLLCLIIGTVVFSAAAFTQKMAGKPNILFILVDDLGKEWISGYGADDIKTPNVDKLAATGLKFQNAYSTPQCTPSRIALFTGQYPNRNGWVGHWDVPRFGGGAHYDWRVNPSLALYMKAAGYATVSVGKWQVNDYRLQPEAMVDHGFDNYCMWTGGEAGVPESDNRYWDPYIHTKDGSKTYKGQFGEDIFSDYLIKFMHGNKGKKPLFMYYAVCLTHDPFTTTPLDLKAETPLEKHKAMVNYMDFIVGKMVKALEDEGLRKNTLIVLTTDNGTIQSITGKMNGREVKGGKTQTTENGINAPYIWNCPGLVPEGITTDALTDFTDMLPTFVDIAGGKLPKKYVFDGVSIKDVVYGKKKDTVREWIMSMGGNNSGNKPQISEKGLENYFKYRDRVFRDKRYKLFVSTKKKPVKLIDLMADPEEKTDLLPALSTNTAAKKVYDVLWAAAQKQPGFDNDPKYIPTAKTEWDTPVTAKSQVWKK